MTTKSKRRWPLLLMVLLTTGCLIWSLVRIESSEASARVESNQIVMASGDLRSLLMAVEASRAEIDVLRRALEEERTLCQGYALRVQGLESAIKGERIAWEDLEKNLNREIFVQKGEKVQWGVTGLVLGAVLGACAF